MCVDKEKTMSKFLKHDESTPVPRRAKAPKPAVPVGPVASEPVSVDLSGIEMAFSGIETVLDDIAKCVRAYVRDATIGEHNLELFTGESCYPVRLVLEGEAVDKIADAMTRVADALEKKPAG
jgi:hypothetical protein